MLSQQLSLSAVAPFEFDKGTKFCTRTIVYGGKNFPRSRDIDNVHKICQDAIVRAGILPGDSVMHVVDSRQTYVEGDKNDVASCLFVIEEYTGHDFSYTELDDVVAVYNRTA